MQVRTFKSIWLAAAFFLIVLAELWTPLKYIGLILLMLICLGGMAAAPLRREDVVTAAAIYVAWVIGFLFQTLSASQAQTAAAYYAVLIAVSIFGGRAAGSVRELVGMAAGFFAGILAVFFYSPSAIAEQLNDTSNTRMRISGSFAHPNTLGYSAFTVIFLLLIVLALRRRDFSRLQKAACVLMIGASAGFLYLSKSRGAWGVTAVFLVIFLSRALFRLPARQRQALTILGAAALLCAGAVILRSYVLTDASYASRISGLFSIDLEGHVLFGYGMVDSASIDYTVLSEGSMEIAWLKLYYKNGVVGILTFVLLILYSVRKALKLRNRNLRRLWWAVCFAFLANSAVESTMVAIFNAFPLCLWISLSALPEILAEEDAEEDEDEEEDGTDEAAAAAEGAGS